MSDRIRQLLSHIHEITFLIIIIYGFFVIIFIMNNHIFINEDYLTVVLGEEDMEGISHSIFDATLTLTAISLSFVLFFISEASKVQGTKYQESFRDLARISLNISILGLCNSFISSIYLLTKNIVAFEFNLLFLMFTGLLLLYSIMAWARSNLQDGG